MKMICFQLCIIFISLKLVSGEYIPIYSCPLKRLVTVHIKLAFVPNFSPENTCILTNVQRNVTDKYFKVQPDNAKIIEIEHVTFEESRMKVFTPDVCEALPYLTYINADRLGLISVEEDAFQQCRKLLIIDLTYNQLTELPPGLFRSNPVLSVVNIEHNQISEVDEGIFARNKVLKDVFFGHNTFYQLPDKLFDNVPNVNIVNLRYNNFSQMPLMNSRVTNLTEIVLSYNHLHDVDVEGIHRKFPNLRKLDLKSNEFLCQRQRDIDREFRQRRVINADLTGTCIETKETWSLTKQLRETKIKERILEAQTKREQAKKKTISTVKPRYATRINNVRSTTLSTPQDVFEEEEVVGEDVPIYSCPMQSFYTVYIRQAVVPNFLPRATCILTGVHRNVTDKYFEVQPEHDIITDIEQVTFEESQMKVFTPDVCEALPHLTYINAYSLGLISVEEDAFQQCTYLKIIDLTNNQLTELPPGLFRSNPVLSVVNIERNKISEVDEEIFAHNKILKDVFFGYNIFYQLPDKLFDNVPNVNIVNLRYNNFSQMPLMNSKVTKLMEIDLSHNHLHDVDVHAILRKFPNLWTIVLRSNEFLCERQSEIYRELKTKKRFINADLTGTCIEFKETWSLIKEERESKIKDRILEAQIAKEEAKKKQETTVKPPTINNVRSTTLSTPQLNKTEEQEVDDDEGDLSVAINSFSTRDCGDIARANKFVHGGEVRSEESFPWVAAMMIKNRYECTANFISRTRAVTAAHCLENGLRPKDIKLEILAFPVVLVKNFKKHPKFRDIPKNDIAILNTEEVQVEKFVPVCLPNKFVSLIGFQGDVLSWAPAPKSDEEALLSARLTVTRRSYCESVTYNVPSHSLCVVHGHKGSWLCKGDSGAGFIILSQNQGAKKRDRRHFLHGIVSTGKVKDRNCSINDHVILTDVTKFLSFVTSP